MRIGDLFTVEEIMRAVDLHEECQPGEFNKRVVEQVVLPILGRINQATGQKNDPRYLGYVLEHAIHVSQEGAARDLAKKNLN